LAVVILVLGCDGLQYQQAGAAKSAVLQMGVHDPHPALLHRSDGHQSASLAELSHRTAIMQLSAGKGFTGGVLELHSLVAVILVNQSIMTCQWQGGLVKHGVYMPHTYPMATGTATVPLK
jgi:hypothetical protein